MSKRAGYDGGQERAHVGLGLCDQERQKDLQGQRAAGRRRQGLAFGYLELLYKCVTYMTWAGLPKKHGSKLQKIDQKQAGLLIVVCASVMEYM